MDYLKLDPNIDTDPDVEAAGWCAARVYELMLKVSAQKDLRGRLSPGHRDPRYLARRWNLTAADLPGVEPADFVANGIARLVAVGLAAYDGPDLVLRGWDKHYKPAKSSAERMATMRARKRDESDAPAVTRDASDESDATHPHTLPTVPTNVTSQVTPAAPGPVFVSLKDRMEAVYLDVRGSEYRWKKADDDALRLMPLEASDEEILRVWASGLSRPFPRCLGVKTLADNWSEYAGAAPDQKTRKQEAVAQPLKHLG